MKLNKEQLLQEAEYEVPAHWRLGHAERVRYCRLSQLIARLISDLPNVRESRAVQIYDIGCGDGLGSYQVWKELRERGVSVEMDGTDFSEKAIQWAQKMTASKVDDSVRFKCVSANSFDESRPNVPIVIVLREVVEHLLEEEIAELLSSVKRLNNGCNLIITTPSVNSPVEEKHYRHYNVSDLVETFESNNFTAQFVKGFAFRPGFLFSLMARIKSGLNRRPKLAWLMNPCWKVVPPSVAITLVAMGSSLTKED